MCVAPPAYTVRIAPARATSYPDGGFARPRRRQHPPRRPSAPSLDVSALKIRFVRPPPQPGAVLSPRLYVFDRGISVAQNIILSQGRFALHEMLGAITRVYRLLDEPPRVAGGVYLHYDIPATLSEICFQGGLASNILFNGSDRRRDESAAAYASRMERFKYVRAHMAAQDVVVTALADKKVRNRLQHVDQFLPTFLADSENAWCIDMALENRDAPSFKPPLKAKFIRTLIVSEAKIIHLDTEISVASLWHEATAVLAGVFGSPPSEPPLALVRSLPSEACGLLRTGA